MVYQQAPAASSSAPAVFANIVLADEINRASPKTQSALLEVMEERPSPSTVPHAVPRPFLVVATQNPIELDGTYRLPEAQLDRFLMRVAVGYPDQTPRSGWCSARPPASTPTRSPPSSTFPSSVR